jgi:hypothetical protein
MIEMSYERMAQRHELHESREATKQDKQCLHESQFDFQVEQTACANKLKMSQIHFRPELTKFMREQQHCPSNDPK